MIAHIIHNNNNLVFTCFIIDLKKKNWNTRKNHQIVDSWGLDLFSSFLSSSRGPLDSSNQPKVCSDTRDLEVIAMIDSVVIKLCTFVVNFNIVAAKTWHDINEDNNDKFGGELFFKSLNLFHFKRLVSSFPTQSGCKSWRKGNLLFYWLNFSCYDWLDRPTSSQSNWSLNTNYWNWLPTQIWELRSI